MHGYNDLREEGIEINPVRRGNERRYEGEWLEGFKKVFRRLIETIFTWYTGLWGLGLMLLLGRVLF